MRAASGEKTGVVAGLADMAGLIDPGIAVPVIVVLAVGFLGWVIVSDGRTVRLERLIRAFREGCKGADDDT
ncbi:MULTISPECIES: hypothetical protein [unclassified Micromonospora]|uniref:hypothetical protein n=1 Tax=unclassified Micromonospora TaxID=2617518 RepID=UPI0034064DF0